MWRCERKIKLIGEKHFDYEGEFYMVRKYPENKFIMGKYDRYNKKELSVIYGY